MERGGAAIGLFKEKLARREKNFKLTFSHPFLTQNTLITRFGKSGVFLNFWWSVFFHGVTLPPTGNCKNIFCNSFKLGELGNFRFSFIDKFFLCAGTQTCMRFFVLKDFVLPNGKLNNTFLPFRIQASFHQCNLDSRFPNFWGRNGLLPPLGSTPCCTHFFIHTYYILLYLFYYNCLSPRSDHKLLKIQVLYPFHIYIPSTWNRTCTLQLINIW